LEAVKGVGSAAIEAILESRNTKKFSSFHDFCLRVDSRRVNKKVIESLIKAGALDSFGKRAQLMLALNSVMDSALKTQKELESGQRNMFGQLETPAETLPKTEEWSDSERLAMEKEALGFYITGHPLSKYKDELARLSVIPTHQLTDLSDREDINIGGIINGVKKIQTKKRGDWMAYLTVEDLYGVIEVIVFPDLLNETAQVITQDTPVIISGQIDKNDKGLKIIAKKITSIQNAEHITTHRVNYAQSKKRATQYTALTLMMHTDTNTGYLSQLKDILLRHSDNEAVPVRLKIISPEQWEALILTNKHVSPSQEMISEIENILGKGQAVLK
ncbi:MAG: hypothetical protein KAI96_08310, partial [Thermodesulfovibrionia bacterium]|nr:hypothetical protein [Thermodesulfovibrionia bacterium]